MRKANATSSLLYARRGKRVKTDESSFLAVVTITDRNFYDRLLADVLEYVLTRTEREVSLKFDFSRCVPKREKEKRRDGGVRFKSLSLPLSLHR